MAAPAQSAPAAAGPSAPTSAPAAADAGNSSGPNGFLHLLESDLKAAGAHGSVLAHEILRALAGRGGEGASGNRVSAQPEKRGGRGGKRLPDGTALPAGPALPALVAQLLQRLGAPPAGGARTGAAAAGSAGTGASDPLQGLAGAGQDAPAAGDALARLLQWFETAVGAKDKTGGGAKGAVVDALSANATAVRRETVPAAASAPDSSTVSTATAAAAPKGINPELAALLRAAGGGTQGHSSHAVSATASARPPLPVDISTLSATAPAHGAGAAPAPAPTPVAFAVVPVSAPAPGSAPVVAHAAPPIPVPPGHPAWGEALGNRVLWVLDQHLPSASVRLNPPGLGPLEIHVSLHQEQAQINFASHHVAVRDAVEAALPRLRELFAGNGLTLAGVNVSHQSLTDQGPREQTARDPRSAPVAPVAAVAGDSPATALARAAPATALGLVDYYA